MSGNLLRLLAWLLLLLISGTADDDDAEEDDEDVVDPVDKEDSSEDFKSDAALDMGAVCDWAEENDKLLYEEDDLWLELVSINLDDLFDALWLTLLPWIELCVE